MIKKLSIITPVYNQEELIIRCLDSIPPRDDIEIIVIDDASTDNTYNNVKEYMKTHKNIVLLQNKTNKGVGYSVNKGLDNATGEYVGMIGSDDYFYTKEFEEIIKSELNGMDLIYYDLRTNDGTMFKLTQESKVGFCGSVKFMRRDFIGDTRCPEIRAGEDWYFYQELLKKNPTEIFTHVIMKHYNFPRENSLSDLQRKGEIK